MFGVLKVIKLFLVNYFSTSEIFMIKEHVLKISAKKLFSIIRYPVIKLQKKEKRKACENEKQRQKQKKNT